ncbi:hypothetical protein BurJ1DRAFT_3176 [Burkholderiales bacterium JOSHI_001]|nr:hypothetical protein BurJ1DRAFT_3176 [Burkholderiales bacterium JOSHI_001]
MVALGTFFIAFSLLFFEVFSTIVMSFVLGSGYIYFVIGISLLGLSAAASLVSVVSFRMDDRKRALTLFWGCVLLAALLVGNLVLFALLKDQINAGVELAARSDGLGGIVKKILTGQLWIALWLGLAMSVPYFVFGAIVTIIFKTLPASSFHKIYFADLFGAAFGCVGAIAALEWGGYALTALLPSVFAMLAGAAYLAKNVSRRTVGLAAASAVVPLVFLAPGLISAIEPVPQLNSLARDYDMKRKVTELWHGWNSYARVGALKSVSPSGEVDHIMALGNGEGHADLRPYQPQGYGDWKQRLAILGQALGAPETALVLFAGTGSDMLALDYYTQHKTKITGVELNHTMIRGALELKEFGLDKFYAQPNIRMVVSEAREFLEQDKNKYKSILLSWSGATIAYYSGSIGHTTQFVYTKEAFESMIDHLTPDGFIVVWNTNKVNSLATFRAIMEERGMKGIQNSSLVLYGTDPSTSDWKRYWDENPLIFKPSGFTAAEINRIKEVAKTIDLSVAYAPGEAVPPAFEPYKRVMTAPDLERSLADLSRESGLRFSVVDDDRPFSLDLFSTSRYLSLDFWQQTIDRGNLKMYEKYRAQQTLFVTGLLVAALVLILGPLAVKGGPPVSRLSAQHLVFFSAVGSGFMLVEIGLVHKLGLLLGNPAFAIAIVLAGLILSAGVGSLISDALFRWGNTFSYVVGFIFVYVILFVQLADPLVNHALAWPLVWRAVLALLVIAPLGLAMGQLFPQGLVRASEAGESFPPWAWAINGALGTIAAGLAPLVAQAVGFRVLLLTGAVIYLSILLLPAYRRAEGRSPVSASSPVCSASS